MVFARFGLLAACVSSALAGQILYDGRAPLNYTSASINGPLAPYVYVVRGSKSASDYVSFGNTPPPTPLWYPGRASEPNEQTISVKIDNSSVFVPGGNPANSQFGFRRTEIIAQNNRTMLETGKTVWHFSIMPDHAAPLDLKHEYQIVFIEPDDGAHVFGVRVGSPFTVPTADKLPVPKAHNVQVLDHATNVIYETSFEGHTWHNFAVQVDWDARTLGVFASKGAAKLKKVTGLIQNSSTKSGAQGQGDFHLGVLKLPLADPNDTAQQQGDVVHRGIQEGTTEGLFYSGAFVETVAGGVSAGYASTVDAF